MTNKIVEPSGKPWDQRNRRVFEFGDGESLLVPSKIARHRVSSSWIVKLRGKPTISFADRKYGSIEKALRAATAHLRKHWAPHHSTKTYRCTPSVLPPTHYQRIVVVDGLEHKVPRYIARTPNGWIVTYRTRTAYLDASHRHSAARALSAATKALMLVWEPGATGRVPKVATTAPWDETQRFSKQVEGVGVLSVPRHVTRCPGGWQVKFRKPTSWFSDNRFGGVQRALEAAENLLRDQWSPAEAKSRLKDRRSQVRAKQTRSERRFKVGKEWFTLPTDWRVDPSVSAPTGWRILKDGAHSTFNFAKYGGPAAAYAAAMALMNDKRHSSGASKKPWESPNVRVVRIDGIDLDVPKGICRRSYANKSNLWDLRIGGSRRTFSDSAHGGPEGALAKATAELKRRWKRLAKNGALPTDLRRTVNV